MAHFGLVARSSFDNLMHWPQEMIRRCQAWATGGLVYDVCVTVAAGVMLHSMERQVTLRVIVERPPGDVEFGVQEGHGGDYKTVQKQRFTNKDLRFEFPIRVKEGKNGQPNFLGSFAQGPANNRFVYLDIGTYAGQTNTPWSRRLKIPLTGITWPMIEQASDASVVIEVRVPGTGGDGGPTCGTVKESSGWMLSE